VLAPFSIRSKSILACSSYFVLSGLSLLRKVYIFGEYGFECRSQWPRMSRLRSLVRWNRELKSHWRHGCLSVCVYSVFVFLCV
jgi:hypothetical protein